MNSSGASRRENVKSYLLLEQLMKNMASALRGAIATKHRSARREQWIAWRTSNPYLPARLKRRVSFRSTHPVRLASLHPSNTASAPFTASALSVTVFSSDPACTAMFSAKNRASAT
jgi:hypothetical protein